MELRKLPKIELHRHLEGALRFSTVKELLKARRGDLPYHDDVALKERLLVMSPMRDLKSVLDKFWTSQSILDSAEVLERITYEAVEDAHAENIQVLELRYSLSFIQTHHENLSYSKIHQSIVRGLERARRDFPVRTGLIGIIGRVDAPEVQARAMDFMVDHAAQTVHSEGSNMPRVGASEIPIRPSGGAFDSSSSLSHLTQSSTGFVGVDLADNETGLETRVLVPLFEKARKAGLHVTIHAGEAPGTHRNVVDSIEMLGAERIGHGLQIYQHPEIIDLVKRKNVTLELCPYSNWLTNAVPSTKAHPFRSLMESGVSVTINSDDPGIFDSDLTHEYKILQTEHGFTDADFQKCYDAASKATFLR